MAPHYVIPPRTLWTASKKLFTGAAFAGLAYCGISTAPAAKRTADRAITRLTLDRAFKDHDYSRARDLCAAKAGLFPPDKRKDLELRLADIHPDALTRSARLSTDLETRYGLYGHAVREYRDIGQKNPDAESGLLLTGLEYVFFLREGTGYESRHQQSAVFEDLMQRADITYLPPLPSEVSNFLWYNGDGLVQFLDTNDEGRKNALSAQLADLRVQCVIQGRSSAEAQAPPLAWLEITLSLYHSLGYTSDHPKVLRAEQLKKQIEEENQRPKRSRKRDMMGH
jgi:hypothetical protein